MPYLLACIFAVPGCGSDSSGATGSPSGSCPTVRYVTAGDAECDTGRGGPMRKIAIAGDSLCVDKTEVTVGQYQQYLASADKPSLPSSDPAAARCAKKANHDPSCSKDLCSGAACDMPQACVDQCDAKAFCAWAGKKLCGAVAGNGLLGIDRKSLLDPAKNQWRAACSPDGREWPYGGAYESQACNSTDRKPVACGGPALTASFPKCQAPEEAYQQVFDLSGNLFEWVDASQEGDSWPNLRCIIMGGSYTHYWGDVDCGEYSTLDWPCDAHHPEFGFRCCSK